MRRHCYLWIVGSIVFLFLWTTVWAAPNISFPEKEWNWGETYSGDKIIHVFTFENKGDQTLEILNIATSCGCTAALISEKSISPGGTGKIEVTFDSTGWRGRNHKVVYLTTNDPAMQKAELRIQGDIIIDLLIDPANVYTGFRERSETQSRDVVLINQGKKPIRILEVVGKDPEIVVENKNAQSIQPGERGLISLKMKLPEKGDRFVGEVMVRTDHPRHQEIVIPVRLQVSAPVPERAMESTPFLEQLRKYKEQMDREKAMQQQKEQPSQTPGAQK